MPVIFKLNRQLCLAAYVNNKSVRPEASSVMVETIVTVTILIRAIDVGSRVNPGQAGADQDR